MKVLLVAVSLLAVFAAPVQAQMPAPSAPDLNARSYYLVDHRSGATLASSSENDRVDPASITKLMTAYAVFRAIEDGQISLADEVLVSEKAWRTPGSRMFIEVGKRVSVEDLLKGMIIQSGNDASVALAEYVAGTEEVFAQVMNQYAQELGMADTNYANSMGLTAENHYTSARDIAILARAIINEFPEYYGWYSQKQFTFNEISQDNRNALLWRDPSVDGMKTGYTEAAGYCLVSSAEREGMRLISVVLGAQSPTARTNDSQALLNYGFRFFESALVIPAGQSLQETRVWKGAEMLADVGVSQDEWMTIPRGSADKLDIAVELPEQISAPLDPAVAVGTATVSLDGKVLRTLDVYPLRAMEEGGLWDIARDTVLLWFE